MILILFVSRSLVGFQMGDLAVNALWTVIGLPLSLISLLYFVLNPKKNIVLQDKVVFITGASSGLGEGIFFF